MIDTPARTPTFVELPREWWLEFRFVDGATRSIPRYERPHCRLLKARYGHPEVGALWGAKLDGIMKDFGLHAVQGTGGVYTHAKTKAAMVVYVDDMLLLASPRDADGIWRSRKERLLQRSRGPTGPLPRSSLPFQRLRSEASAGSKIYEDGQTITQ